MNTPENNQPLSSEEIEQAAKLLDRLPRGYLPTSIFLQITRLVATPTMEVAPMRTNNGQAEIYLTQRPADDPYWANGWHIPGTVLRSTDEEGSFASGLERVRTDELGQNFKYTSDPELVTVKFWDVLRGREVDFVHYIDVEVEDDAGLSGQFFSSENIPETTLSHHKILIPEIFGSYIKRSAKRRDS